MSLPRAKFTDPLLAARKERRRELFKGYVTRPLLLAALILSPFLALVHWVLPPVVIAGTLATCWYYADWRADKEWWPQLLQSLGFTPGIADLPPLTPLLRAGDKRKALAAGSDGRRQLVHFRVTEVRRQHTKNGSVEREEHSDHTLVAYAVDGAPVIRFLSAHPHHIGAMKWLGDALRGRAPAGVETFELESVSLHRKFELRASTEEATRAREIFEPSFIVWFEHKGIQFEYEHGMLVVAVPRLLEHAEELRLLLARADEIARHLHA